MKIIKPYRNILLTQLSQAALLEDYSDSQIDILDQAALLLWRFDNSIFPISGSEIVPLLSENITSWLPKNITLGFNGLLKFSGQATYLAHEFIAELSGNPFTRRDQTFENLTSQIATTNKSILNFRNIMSCYETPTIIPTQNDLPKALVNAFYSPFTKTFHGKKIVSCPSCGYPLDVNMSPLNCKAVPCYKFKYSPTPPHLPINRAGRHLFPKQLEPSEHLKINHEIWKTLSIPIMIEDDLINWLDESAPDHLGLAYRLNPNRPGLFIESNTEQPCRIEIFNSLHFRSIVDYCLESDTGEEVWLILPNSSHIETYSVSRMLPKNFVCTTNYSFTKQYLAIKHRLGNRY